MQIKEETENEAETQAITQAADGQQLDFLDLSLIKIFNGGEPQDIGSDNNRLLAVTLPYSSWGKRVEAVYRYHDGNVDVLTTTPNSDGEYFVATKETVTVYAKKFSTYAIGCMEIEESLQSVTYEYSVAPTYTVTIPSEVKLGQTYTVAANNVVLEYGKYVRVLLCNTSDDQGAFALQNSFGDKIGYGVTVDGDAVEILAVDTALPMMCEGLIRSVLNTGDCRGAVRGVCRDNALVPILRRLEFEEDNGVWTVSIEKFFRGECKCGK